MACTYLTLCAVSTWGALAYACLTENSLRLLRAGASVVPMRSVQFYIKPILPLQRLLQILGLGTPAFGVASLCPEPAAAVTFCPETTESDCACAVCTFTCTDCVHEALLILALERQY